VLDALLFMFITIFPSQTFQDECHKHPDASHMDEELHRYFLEEMPEHLVSSSQHRCHIGFMDSPGFSKHLKITGGAL